jgi:hypothetical protein
VRPIFLVFPPFTATNEAVISNVISVTQDLTKYLDVSYYIHYDHWGGNFSKLEEIISTYEKYDAKVAIMIIHGWDTPDHLDGKMVLTSEQIASLKQKHNNFNGMVIAEYFTRYPENSTMLSRYETVLREAIKNGLWVAHEEEWWTWGMNIEYENRMCINHTVVTPIIQQYSDVIISVSKTNGAGSQYVSWGTNIGHSLSFGTRWGISIESWYWYEIRARVLHTQNDMPIDIMITSALYALIHNATYLTFDPPYYFFKDDGTPNDRFLRFKEALLRYFENGAPKISLPRIAILNLPVNFEPEHVVTSTGVTVMHIPDFRRGDLFTYQEGRYGNGEARNIQKMLYNFDYDPEGLINTKTLIPVLPWGTSIQILRKFDFIIVNVPVAYLPIYNFTYVKNPQEIYNYLLEASQYVDLFFSNACIFATNVTFYYDDVLGKLLYSFIYLNHSSLTGLLSPYEGKFISWGGGVERTYNVTFNHARYAKTITNITTDIIVAAIEPTQLKPEAKVIITINNTYPFMWQYTNEYGRNIYTINEVTTFRDIIRDYIGEFMRSIAHDLLDDISKFGILLYNIEYDPTKYNTPEMAIRPQIVDSIKAAGNITILYAPFTYDGENYNIRLSPNYPYAIVKIQS